MKQLCLTICAVLTVSNFIQAATDARTVATIPIAGGPIAVAITPNGKLAYVADIGGRISVVDTASNTVIKTMTDVSLGLPYWIAINPAGTKAYVASVASASISIIDIATNTITSLSGFVSPSGIAITADSSTAYVCNSGNYVLNVVNLTTNTITNAITVDSNAQAIAITPDNAYVYVACANNGGQGRGVVSVVQTRTNRVVKTIQGFSLPQGIAITPDGSQVYVTNLGDGLVSSYGTTVSIIDTKTNKVINAVTVGVMPEGVAITPNGAFAYVANYNILTSDDYSRTFIGEGTVSIINTKTQQVLGVTLLVGSGPYFLAITPDGTRAYVPNSSNGSVTVLNIDDQMWLNT